jgi:hypothetical protein
VGRVDVDPAALHTLLDDALTDCLARALPGPAISRSAARERHGERGNRGLSERG